MGLDNWCPVAWHSSGSDPFYTSEAAGRMSYYGSMVQGYPTCVFDGVITVVGGSSNTYNDYKSMYDYRRMFPSPLTITFLSRSYSENKACVSVKVKLEENLAAGNVCHIVLWEDKVPYGGRDYRFVERAQAPYEAITITNAGQEQIIKREFTLNAGWNKANLGVTAFVQNLTAKDIKNGRAAKLVAGNAVEPSSLGRVKAMFQ